MVDDKLEHVMCHMTISNYCMNYVVQARFCARQLHKHKLYTCQVIIWKENTCLFSDISIRQWSTMKKIFECYKFPPTRLCLETASTGLSTYSIWRYHLPALWCIVLKKVAACSKIDNDSHMANNGTKNCHWWRKYTQLSGIQLSSHWVFAI